MPRPPSRIESPTDADRPDGPSPAPDSAGEAEDLMNLLRAVGVGPAAALIFDAVDDVDVGAATAVGIRAWGPARPAFGLPALV
ncbi:MAG TPA: hypothetical protein PKY70_18410 [Nakamurella multipartita]|nr:hypothetical protein [Nakamurella multipartita]